MRKSKKILVGPRAVGKILGTCECKLKDRLSTLSATQQKCKLVGVYSGLLIMLNPNPCSWGCI
jgi:hypothetical protein